MQEYNSKIQSNYVSYSTLQKKIKNISKCYIYQHDLSGCPNPKLLHKLATELVLKTPRSFQSVTESFEARERNDQVGVEHRASFESIKKLPDPNKEKHMKTPPSYIMNSAKGFLNRVNLSKSKNQEDISLLLQLAFKLKPYFSPSARVHIWKQVTDEYNSLIGSSETYTELKDQFDQMFFAFYYEKESAYEEKNLKLLKKIAAGYENCKQKKENDETSYLIRLIDKYKVYVNLCDKDNDKWLEVLDEFNNILGLNFTSFASPKRRFLMIVKDYNENSNIFHLGCDNFSLLDKIVKQFNIRGINFPKDWLTHLLNLIDKFKPFNNNRTIYDHAWNKILEKYNFTLKAKIDELPPYSLTGKRL